MLDTNENSILKNAETKSVILAPFNSTKSNIETSEQFLEQVRDLLEDRRCIKFDPRVREIAKQYEVNNNAELDNGVQHDFLEEEAKNKVSNNLNSSSSFSLYLPPPNVKQFYVMNFTILSDDFRLPRSKRKTSPSRTTRRSRCSNS